ncbi:MAG: hypothetical protein HOU01_02955 [Streptomycetaceae bacterium]|nr:hypothetical protein [Streptomycetaceae bacterium]
MSELGLALIAAGSAVAGGAVTGWLSLRAGRGQADAARHAGDRQADAVITSVRMTLADQRETRAQEQRRKIYEQFLDATGLWATGVSAANGIDSRAAGERAFTSVLLEGPPDVVETAAEMLRMLRLGHADPTTFDQAKSRFVDAARVALAFPAG